MSDANFATVRTAVIQDVIQLTREKYVYPQIGNEIAARIQAKLEDGGYDDLADGQALAIQLTSDLRSFSNDHHWSVVYDPRGAAGQVDPENEADNDRLARYLAMARKTNFGFERVERLKGNVGYIDLRRFDPSEHAGETAVAAMNFVANCDALIFDLRKNHGGYPSMVQLITSYLVDPEPRHINTFYYRPTDDTQQFWTFPHVPGKRRPDIPVYVLVSHETGSGAEEFAYNLKHMERATLIGETTVGAAHPVTKEVVQRVFDVRLPYGRPINPITGSNWERTGVEPHIAVPAQDALKTAHLLAVEHLAENCQDENDRHALAWAEEIIKSEYSPIVLEQADLARCTGQFDKHRFTIENGDLVYGHQDIPASWKLVPMTKTRFRLDEDIKFEFSVQDGKATSVKITYLDGRPEVVTNRTG
ncbi:MAG: S41 family peptidase [Anaerolineae bacterium]|nr:S41 family peptidase [Anaerolineae bacterium]